MSTRQTPGVQPFTLGTKLQALVYDILPSTNCKHWFTTSVLQPLPYLVTPKGPKICQLTSSVLLALKQNYFCYKQLKLYHTYVLSLIMLLTPAQIKPKLFESRRNSFCVCFSPVVLKYRTITWPICYFHSHSHTFLMHSRRHWGCSSVNVL